MAPQSARITQRANMEPYLPVANAFDVEVASLTDATTEAAVTDAALVCTVRDEDGTIVPGCNAVSLTHQGSGTYRGRVTPTTELVDGANYRLTITSAFIPTPYVVKWDQWFTAYNRKFEWT